MLAGEQVILVGQSFQLLKREAFLLHVEIDAEVLQRACILWVFADLNALLCEED